MRWNSLAAVAVVVAVCALWAWSAAKDNGEPIVRPAAVLATESVPHGGDAADDPAIWVHPADSARSLVLGTDKQGGLHAYNLEGKQVQVISESSHPNNVDVLYGFRMPDGREVDLAVATTRGPGRQGVKCWAIAPEAGLLADVTAGEKAAANDEVIRVFDGQTPYGIGGYHSARTGKHFFFISDKAGQIEQYELVASGVRVGARRVRAWKFNSTVEGTVADDEWGFVYFAEESRGIWKVRAEPDARPEPELVVKAGEHGLKSDVEGLTIYCTSDGRGYLIASSQGNNTFKVYRREGKNEFVCTIDPKAGALDDVEDTDGIAVINLPMGPRFPKGFLVVQDGSVPRKHQNFKFFRWEDIAADRLLIDTSWNPRKIRARE